MSNTTERATMTGTINLDAMGLAEWLRHTEKVYRRTGNPETADEYGRRAMQAEELIEIVDRYIQADNGTEDELNRSARAALAKATGGA